MTLYASWTVIKPFEIIFEDVLGVTFQTKEAYDGDSITAPTTSPTKDGSQFVGWDRTNGTAWDFANDKVVSDLTLKPRFTPITYTITYHIPEGTTLYYDVYIEGVVDFIFGNGGPAFFENSTIKSLARSTVVIATNKEYNVSSAAQITYGYVFYQNDFIFEEGVPAGSVDLGRPWDQMAAIAYIDNVFGAHISTKGWTEMSGRLPENARFFEYQNKDDNQVLLPKTTNSQLLTPEQAALYMDKAVVFGTENGSVTFGNVWAYQNKMTFLQAISFS